jgi:O-antigen/teichoic acid export membrane protein
MGVEFLDAAPVLFTLTVAMTSAFIVNPLDNLLYAVARHRALALINVGDAIANLTLSLLLGRWLGMWGVALGTLIPMLISRFVFVAPYSCRQIGLPLGRYFGEVFLGLGSMLVCVLGAAFIARKFIGDGSYTRLIVLGGGMAAVYGVGAWCIGLRRADRERLLAILNLRRGVERPA